LVSSIVLCVVFVLVSVARWLNAIILIVARCAQSMNPLAAVLDATLVVNFDVVSIKKDDTNDNQK